MPNIAFEDSLHDDTPHVPMASKLFRKPTVGHIADLISPSKLGLMDAFLGGRIGIMASGGICAGMNAAIRAVVRMALYMSCDVVYIRHGLLGLVKGGKENFELATLASTLDIIGKGGSIISSFEGGQEYFVKQARLQAAMNLVDMNLTRLVIIGCAETMQIIEDFHKEWPSLLREIEDKEMASPEKIAINQDLNVAIIASSISNDVCGTDMCLGASSALHRIIEATDNLATTSFSMKQAFVIEVIGKQSGFLALAGCIAASGTMAYIPEWPPRGDWREELKAKVNEDIIQGVGDILCFVPSGAIDVNGLPITVNDVRDVLVQEFNIQTVVTVLGQVQRGGNPSACDRLFAARLGAEAVMALHVRKDMDVPCVMGIVGNDIVCASLSDVTGRNRHLVESLKTGEYATAVRLRGVRFQRLLSGYNTLHRLQPSPLLKIPELKGIPQIAIIRCGRYSIAQCLATKSIVGYCASKGIRVLGVMNGFHGLLTQNVVYLTWDMVMKWNAHTAECMRSSRILPEAIGMKNIATAFRAMKLHGLILLGSFHAFEALHQMWKAQHEYKELCIPMCYIPVTILNNIPGSAFTIGTDSACNENVEYCEKMKRVARSQTDSVIVVETLGHKCGFITTITAICVGAEMAYIFNEPFTFATMLKDVENVKKKFREDGMRLTLVLHSTSANQNYNSEFTHKLFSEEGKGLYDCRRETIGHVQIGVTPSPFDRLLAILHGLKAAEWLGNRIEDLMSTEGTIYTNSSADKVVVCYQRHTTLMSIARLSAETDFKQRLPTYLWWKKLRTLMRILAKKEEEGNYVMEALPVQLQSEDQIYPYQAQSVHK